ncbi:hypothetical protein MAR_011299 [Mya arenaria]|uniref:Uncharacterized protein n=1 Tax=Mya arenaria TaxID=6604 RepID=A0ABY7FTR3_MYAAR|nr:hypothetical protein MAR_011299 [Mya arenaria]
MYMDYKELTVPERTLFRWKQKQKLIDNKSHGNLLTESENNSAALDFLSKTLSVNRGALYVPESSCASSSKGASTNSFVPQTNDDSMKVPFLENASSHSVPHPGEPDTTNTDFLDTESESETEPESEKKSSDLTKDNTSYKLTDEMKALKIVSCFRRHNLTISASKDITETMKSIFQDSKHAGILKYEYLMSFVEKHPLHEVHYCEICTELFPDDSDNYRCQTENCEADIEKQFKDLLQSPGVMKDIHKQIMTAKSRMDWKGDTITDITDGSAYRKILHESLMDG